MRVSSAMIHDAGLTGITRQTLALLKVQQQLSSGRRIQTPGDDPVAAARALEVSQAKEIVAQFGENQQAAIGALGIEEAQLAHAEELLQRVRELAVQAGSTTLTPVARKGIAVELRATYQQLLGIANSKDPAGNYLFGGYMSDTQPFAGAIDALVSGGEIAYAGDQGQRVLQLSSSRFVAISDSGVDVFRRIPNGNGYFATDYNAANTGTATIDSGSVSDPAAWRSAAAAIDIRFTVSGGSTTYDLVDTATGNSLLSGGPAPAPAASQRPYLPGQRIALTSQGAEPAFDYGSSVTVTGTPASGDSFSLAPSAPQSIFATVAKLVGALENGATTPAGDARYMADLRAGIASIDQGIGNVVRVRAQVGTRMNEIESLQTVNGDLDLQYQQTLSELTDVDYTAAITELTRRQAELEAAQQSYLRISQLSLFSLL